MLPILIAMGAMQAMSSIAGGIAGMNAGKDQKQLFDFNAGVAVENAKMARAKAEFDVDRFEDKMNQFFGVQKSQQAASGFAVGTGSNADVEYTSRYFAELDEATIRYEGQVEARKWMIEAINAREQGHAAESQGKGAMISSLFKAGGSILGAWSAAKYGKQGGTT
jgi:hypothetical protein